jgi:hypothetical protein
MFSVWSVPKLYNEDNSRIDGQPVSHELKVDGWSNENPSVRAIGQGEARHRKYKRLTLGGGQAYNRSSV